MAGDRVVGDRINKFCDDTCRNKSEVARRAGITPKSFHEMLNGKRKIDMDVLRNIGNVLGVPASKFIDD